MVQNLALLGVGAAVGAGVALLLAPASGSETRKRLSQGVEKLSDQAVEKLQQAQAEASNLADRVHNGPSHAS
jgi:gas vesicle protein